MILHKLIYRYLKYGDDPGFYMLQALDTVRWLRKSGIELGGGIKVLDLGCGHGMIGGELAKKGCRVTFADEKNEVLPEYGQVDFRRFDINADDFKILGTYDLVICSNVLEHIPRPGSLLEAVDFLLKPGGKVYLSWTNWLSPWGGHDYSPFHYLGPRRGHLLYDRLVGGTRTHTPYASLWPTSIGATLRTLRRNPRLRILRIMPRYAPELAIIARLPVLREVLTLNCLILLERSS